MNILYLSWRGPGHPNAGGAEFVALKHMNAWVLAGHKVTLFTSEYLGSKREESLNGVKIIREGGQVMGVKLAAMKYYLKNKTFDLVVDEFHGLPFFTSLYVGVKKLAIIHEVAKEVWKLNPWPKPLNLIPWLLGNVFEKFVFVLYKNIPFMTVSKSTKKDLLAWGMPEKNISIIYNGLDNPKIKSIKKNREKTAMYLGALAKDKGIDDALETFKLLYLKDNTWQFYIAGKGDSENIQKFNKFVNVNKMRSNLTYYGYVSNKEKYKLLSLAHVLLNPSVREGWGLVNLEANLMGTPVVAYDVPGIRDSVRHNVTGILCKDNRTKCLAEEVEKLVNNKKNYQRMSRKAIVWAKGFSWKKATSESLELIENIML